MSTETNVMPRLRKKYKDEIVSKLMERFQIKNVMQVPKVEKIVLNAGVGSATQDKKKLDEAVTVLQNISGQKPVVTKAKKAISNFRLREGVPIGCKVTLRGEKMWEFLDRLVSISIPRVRDFRGVSRKSFDGHGNYTLGVKENIIFMEVDRDKISNIAGLDITICTSADNNELALGLLEEIGMPFRK